MHSRSFSHSRERHMKWTFRGGLLIGLAVAVAVAATATPYERYYTRTLKRTGPRGEELWGGNAGLPRFSIPADKGNWTGFDADYFRANNMKYQEIKFAKLDEVIKAYDSGQCDTFTADVSQLYALRLNLGKPGDHIILPDVISKEPLAPVVRQRDDDWMMIVKWTLYAMINAEELGVTSKNIDEALKSKKPDVMRLVGTEGAYGEELGLSQDWASAIIRHIR